MELLRNFIRDIYPTKANEKCKRFLQATLLLYGEATKIIDTKSVFTEEQIEVIGNQGFLSINRNLEKVAKTTYILFTSQPFGAGCKRG